jgi:hypothetical protein
MSPFTHLIGRKPFVIGGDADPYLRRWWIIPRNSWFNIYLHHFQRSDDDRALHDHPWWNVSVLLHGEYLEWMRDGSSRLRMSPAVVFRSAEAAHRIELVTGPVWTLFITGPKVREWGFLCPKGWRHWRDFTNMDDGGATVGRGCD